MKTQSNFEIGTEYILQYSDKIMKQNKIKRVRFTKTFLNLNAILILYNQSNPFYLLSQKAFLHLETVDVIYAPARSCTNSMI